ncbi:oligopeptide/dipeptide ABC transporter ATP-binding protein [Nonomuraea recticatena]
MRRVRRRGDGVLRPRTPLHLGPARLDAASRQRAHRAAAAHQGITPSLINVPPGCAFHPRCPYAERTEGRAETEVPELLKTSPGHLVRCHMAPEERRQLWESEIKPMLETT